MFLLALAIFCFCDYNHPHGYKVVPHRDYDFYFSVNNDVEHLFTCLLTICILLQIKISVDVYSSPLLIL